MVQTGDGQYRWRLSLVVRAVVPWWEIDNLINEPLVALLGENALRRHIPKVSIVLHHDNGGAIVSERHDICHRDERALIWIGLGRAGQKCLGILIRRTDLWAETRCQGIGEER